MEAIDPFVFRLSIFVLAIFVGYFVVWSVTPALHTPLMSVTNAISSVIVVGALIAVAVRPPLPLPPVAPVVDTVGDLKMYVDGSQDVMLTSNDLKKSSDADTAVFESNEAKIRAAWISKGLGLAALILASVNIFGGFLVTSRMLAMYKKKEKK